MTSPSVSVVIPTYKHRDFVVDTLVSVFAQTFTEYEVIVVNDGSPDDTAAVLRPYVTSGQIRYIDQPNRGQAAARNRGLAEAKGEFVAFLDDDDVWPADKLEWQVDCLSRNESLVVVGGDLRILNEGGDVISRKFNVQDRILNFDDLWDGNPFWSPGQTLIRASAIRAIGGYDAGIWGADDYDLWFRLACKGGIGLTNRLSLSYRMHTGNASKALERMLSNTVLVFRKQLNNVSRHARPQVERRAFRYLYLGQGRQVINNIRRHGRAGAFRSALADLRILQGFARPAGRDPLLAYWAFRDVLRPPSRAQS